MSSTGVKLRVKGVDRTRKAHLWVYIGDADFPYAVFDFTVDHTAAGPERFLEGYRGYLQADALTQYEGLYGDDRVKHCCCRAHARRKFVTAAEGGDTRACTSYWAWATGCGRPTRNAVRDMVVGEGRSGKGRLVLFHESEKPAPPPLREAEPGGQSKQ